MDSWVPLFDIFLNSPSPESEASLWLQQSFNASSSTSTTITTSSFLSLLTKPSEATVVDDSSSSTPSSPAPQKKRIMWIQTLPNMIQARILSFLLFERQRFCARGLSILAQNILGGNQELDFWVKKAARNLLDTVSDSNCEWIFGLSLDSMEDRVDDEFESVPDWLNEAAGSNDLFLPWLPISSDELNTMRLFSPAGDDSESIVEEGDFVAQNMNVVVKDTQIVSSTPSSFHMDPEIQKKAACFKAQILNFESTSKTLGLANEIRQLCLDRGGGDSFAVLGLIEPWEADDETASVLISHLAIGTEDELAWPSQVLCSIVLPKLLVLEQPTSRVLLTAIIEYCKHNQRAAVNALVFPLILRKDGINNPICDVITRIIRECLHPAHVSSFCQKLLCEEENARRFICLPCHRFLISNELVWTESLFNLFQNILNHNVHLTQDSIDHLVYQVQKLADKFSNSLKLGNFLLCFVTKCSPSLKSHKLSLIKAVQDTSSLVTKSVLSKLASL